MKSGSNLEKILTAGHFAFTGELGPPRGANVETVRKKAAHLKGMVDAVNITDNQTAVVRMSSWARPAFYRFRKAWNPTIRWSAGTATGWPCRPISWAPMPMGIRNMLCLSGDHQQFGDHPEAKGVFDIDSMQLIGMVKTHARRRQVPKRRGNRMEPPEDFYRRSRQPLCRTL